MKWFPSVTLPLLAILSLPLPSMNGHSADAAPPFDTNIFVELAQKAVPSVVNISTLTTLKNVSPQGSPEDLFRRFFGDFFGHGGGMGTPEGPGGPGNNDEDNGGPRLSPQQMPKAMSLGTGFIIDSSGIILTNNHVVSGAEQIKIQFTETPGETPTDGEVIGRDPDLDVALVRAKTKRKLVPLPLGDSEALKVGEFVMAVGNPFGQGHSVSHGIISAKGRTIPESPLSSFLQTDAPINPGNSGGPLLNLRGEVIGINAAIVAQAQGIGFAIPINAVKAILGQLETKGVVSRGYLGVLVGPLTPDIAAKLGAPKDLEAPFVTQVYKDSPAEKAGLQPYDIIVGLNGKTVHTSTELVTGVTAVPVGNTAELKVLRGGKELTVPVKVEARPGASEAAAPSKRQKRPRKQQTHALTGLTLEDLTPDLRKQLGLESSAKGVLVAGVTPGSPADQAGLSTGDLIVEVDRKAMRGADDFEKAIHEKGTYLLRVRRPGPHGQDVYSVTVLKLG